MPNTPTYNFPYPALTDDPNVPEDIQLLAQAVEDEIERVDSNVSLVLGAAQAFTTALVATSQSTTSTTYADLATVGPSVSVTTGTFAIVFFTATAWQNSASASDSILMSIAVSGATTIAAADATAMRDTDVSGLSFARRYGNFVTFTTLTPGVNTFTAKYRTSNAANAANFGDRRIAVYAPTATLAS